MELTMGRWCFAFIMTFKCLKSKQQQQQKRDRERGREKKTNGHEFNESFIVERQISIEQCSGRTRIRREVSQRDSYSFCRPVSVQSWQMLISKLIGRSNGHFKISQIKTSSWPRTQITFSSFLTF